jgi:hypothetical protein
LQKVKKKSLETSDLSLKVTNHKFRPVFSEFRRKIVFRLMGRSVSIFYARSARAKVWATENYEFEVLTLPKVLMLPNALTLPKVLALSKALTIPKALTHPKFLTPRSQVADAPQGVDTFQGAGASHGSPRR